jgi:hypothetical protein
VPTDLLGDPLGPIPGQFPVTNAYQQRQVQVGFKFFF